jgi:serine/threonine-protein kinase
MGAPVNEGDVLAGKYRVERVIGVGGMGVVVAAHHLQLARRVALKFLLPEACSQPGAVERFLREARAAAQIGSEHVTRVSDVGTLETGAPYMVMEYLKGSDLAALIKARGRLSIQEAADFVLQACEAVAEAHAIGIVHRDLKPANLFLSQRADGSPLIKVLDFGISKATVGQGDMAGAAVTATAAVMGSPLYMSPEQIRSSKNVDARTDVWALGVILHELLTGRTVYHADTMAGVLAMVVADPPTPLRTHWPEAPQELERVILACLEKDPARRMPSVAALAQALLPFAPPASRVSVDRIVRVLGAGRPPDSSPGNPELVREGTSGGTVTFHQSSSGLLGMQPGSDSGQHGPGAGGHTAQAWGQTGRQPTRRRSAGAIAAVTGAVLLVGSGAWFLHSSRSPVAAPSASPPPTTEVHAAMATAVPIAPDLAPSPAPPPPATNEAEPKPFPQEPATEPVFRTLPPAAGKPETRAVPVVPVPVKRQHPGTVKPTASAPPGAAPPPSPPAATADPNAAFDERR